MRERQMIHLGLFSCDRNYNCLPLLQHVVPLRCVDEFGEDTQGRSIRCDGSDRYFGSDEGGAQVLLDGRLEMSPTLN
jgi:hypothetical protein